MTRTRSEINYVVGDATRPIGGGPKIIAHVVNDQGAWGAGFTRALDAVWPAAREDYTLWHRDRHSRRLPFELGETRHDLVAGGSVGSNEDVWVSHMLAQQGLPNSKNRRPLRYDALGHCLWEVGKLAKTVHASVHMPRIGCGLAGGRWSIVQELISDSFCWDDIPVYVYDIGSGTSR